MSVHTTNNPTAQSRRSGLRLGMEVECLLSSRHDPDSTSGYMIRTFADLVCKKYNQRVNRKIAREMHGDLSTMWNPLKHREWDLTIDMSIRGETNTKFGLEIISPILHFDPSNAWRQEIVHMFATLSTDFLIETNRSCGFHVHLSPGKPKAQTMDRGDWTIDELTRIAMAVVYFENAFEAVIPAERRGNKYHRANRAQNQYLAELSIDETMRRISEVRDIPWFVLLMQQSKRFNWNFMHLSSVHGKGTIEFRQPPGVTTAAECLQWMELAIDFIQSARRDEISIRKLYEFEPTVQGLKKFCYEGLTPGMSMQCYLDPIFDGKTGALEPLPVALDDNYADLIQLEQAQVRRRRLTGGFIGPWFFEGTDGSSADEEEDDEVEGEDDDPAFTYGLNALWEAISPPNAEANGFDDSLGDYGMNYLMPTTPVLSITPRTPRTPFALGSPRTPMSGMPLSAMVSPMVATF